MQIAINISEESYKNIKEQVNKRDYPDMKIGRAIADGVPLPKGHGRIGDLTKLYNEIDARNKGEDKGKYTGILALVGFADTIIEADKN